MAMAIRDRAQIPRQYCWSTEDIFADEAAWERAIEGVRVEMARMEAYRDRLAEGPGVALEALEQMDRVRCALSPVMLWPRLCYQVETADQTKAGRFDRSRTIGAQAAAAMAFIEPELVAIGFETLDEWVRAEPGLADHRRMLDRLRRRQAHVCSPDVERVLSLAEDPFEAAVAIHSVLVNTDLHFQPAQDSDGNEHQITQSGINALLGDADRTLRRTAWQNYQDGYLACRNTLAASVATGIKQLVLHARVRGYGSTLEAAMHKDELPISVYDNVIDVFRRNLPVWHRCWRLRRQAMEIEQVHGYDLAAPLSRESMEVPYEQAVQWVCDGMEPLGDEYVSVLRRGCGQERWVDVYPTRSKRMGAFAASGSVPHPYVFVNYHDDMSSVSTLAHELGHAMHGYFTRRHQRLQNCTGYGNFLGETASNFNQALVRHHLYQTQTDPHVRFAIVEEALFNFHRYMFVMPMLSQIEHRMHQQVEQGEALTADGMMQWMADLLEEGYGGEVAMDRERMGMTWAAFPAHICKNFYAFKYMTGIAAAHALASRVLDDKQAGADYMALLQSGGSRGPLETLQAAGVDMQSPEPVQAAFDVLTQWLDRIEALLPEAVNR